MMDNGNNTFFNLKQKGLMESSMGRESMYCPLDNIELFLIFVNF